MSEAGKRAWWGLWRIESTCPRVRVGAAQLPRMIGRSEMGPVLLNLLFFKRR